LFEVVELFKRHGISLVWKNVYSTKWRRKVREV